MDDILHYYQQSSEADRLTAGSGLLEFARSQEIIQRYLPPPPARILDVGGGPGAYAGWLASLGYEVHLLDPVPKHIESARRLPLATVQLGDARALPYEDASADVVLVMGPLYHLESRGDRVQALREVLRVLRPAGFVCAAAITRYASLLHSLIDGFVDDEEFWPVLQRDLAEGQHRNHTDKMKYFTTAVFHRPDELRAEVLAAGFATVEVLGIEGPGWLAKDFDERWADPHRRQRLLTLVRQVEREEPLLGCNMHLMAIGRKSCGKA
ncbi:MAG TPA: class I SAM-dependent methyltransferase [Bryobacteraceae bacterium]|nr:class I SAM-dependent methyltransferase [Bryobacteraceae bacterium]